MKISRFPHESLKYAMCFIAIQIGTKYIDQVMFQTLDLVKNSKCPPPQYETYTFIHELCNAVCIYLNFAVFSSHISHFLSIYINNYAAFQIIVSIEPNMVSSDGQNTSRRMITSWDLSASAYGRRKDLFSRIIWDKSHQQTKTFKRIEQGRWYEIISFWSHHMHYLNYYHIFSKQICGELCRRKTQTIKYSMQYAHIHMGNPNRWMLAKVAIKHEITIVVHLTLRAHTHWR